MSKISIAKQKFYPNNLSLSLEVVTALSFLCFSLISLKLYSVFSVCSEYNQKLLVSMKIFMVSMYIDIFSIPKCWISKSMFIIV